MIENLNVIYKGDMTARSMCFEADASIGDFREKMLINNNISGYLPLAIHYEGDIKVYEYTISDRTSLSDYILENPVNEALIKKILVEMEKIFLRGRGYVLSENSFVLNPQAIFFIEDRMELCYYPGFEKDIKSQICDLLAFLMDSVDVSNKQAVYAAYSTFALAKEDNCTFKQLINNLENINNSPLTSSAHEYSEEELKELDIKKEENKKQVSKGGGKITTILGYIAVLSTFATLIVYFMMG